LKIAHLSDTHIRNLKYHYEYRVAFDDLYQKLRVEKPDYIVHCGDIAHTKTQISPEFVEMCSNFLSNLADIAPTVLILGNHDGNLRNSSRQDAITPIVAALNHKNLHLLKNSGEFSLDNIVTFNVLSVFDEDNWVDPSDLNKINIALYHGGIAGSKTDTNWAMEHTDHSVRVFDKHDYAFLGDIHKTNQQLNLKGTIRYPGSTVQQNFGETNDKGFLIWEIENKDTFTCRHIKLHNPRPFISIELTQGGKFPRGLNNIPEKARLRLISKTNLPINVVSKAVDAARHRFNAESVTYVSKAGSNKQLGGSEEENLSLNLRDPKIQKQLICEYLEDFNAEDELVEKVLDLNQKYNRMAEEKEDVLRNVNWRVRTLEWHNLFNYGKNNYIDFDKLEGIVGIFGKNFSGKSSVIDSLLYSVFNTTSKNERKTINIINQHQSECDTKLCITSGNKDYYIHRRAEKYTKRLKGSETQEAKTLLDFEVVDRNTGERSSLNGTTRNQTDAAIRKNFGTIDDFLLTSMSSQFGALSFIEEGSTKRKEVLAKFLDLELFETKFNLAKEDSADLRGAIRKLENNSYKEELEDAESDLEQCRTNLNNYKEMCKSYKTKIDDKADLVIQIQEKIDNIPEDIADIGKLKVQVIDKKKQLFGIKESLKDNRKVIKSNITKKQKLDKLFISIDIEEVKEKFNKIEDLNQKVTDLTSELGIKHRKLTRCQGKVELLENIPCGTKFPTCKFISDAYAAKARIPDEEKEITDLGVLIGNYDREIENLNPREVQDLLNKYEHAVELYSNIERETESSNLIISRDDEVETRLETEIDSLEKTISLQEENKEAIDNFEELVAAKSLAEAQKNQLLSKEDECNESLMELSRGIGSLEQRVENTKKNIKDLQELEEEFSAYNLYMKAMHPNGLAYGIIKSKLPVINEEIAKVLANIVDFQVFFENEGKRLNIYIKHPKHDARPLSMGSGAEKSIAAMAIRLALLSVSSLPKSDIFILDEPGTALDEGNMEGFVRILDMIKCYFKTVVLITHLDNLKDCVDTQILIEKNGEYAQVRVE